MASKFEIKQIRVIKPVHVGTTPEEFFASEKYEITLPKDTRFVRVKAKRIKRNSLDVLIPLTNVAYLFYKDEDDKPNSN